MKLIQFCHKHTESMVHSSVGRPDSRCAHTPLPIVVMLFHVFISHCANQSLPAAVDAWQAATGAPTSAPAVLKGPHHSILAAVSRTLPWHYHIPAVDNWVCLGKAYFVFLYCHSRRCCCHWGCTPAPAVLKRPLPYLLIAAQGIISAMDNPGKGCYVSSLSPCLSLMLSGKRSPSPVCAAQTTSS